MRPRSEMPFQAVDLPRSGHVIPLPDLSPLGEKEYGRHTEFDFPFPGHENALSGRVEYEMGTGPSMNVRISALDKNGNLALVFNSNIRMEDPFTKREERLVPESGPSMRATVFTRKVVPEYRKRRLGETSMRLLEETILRIGDARPDLKPRWIQVLTGLESTSNLVVDPNWLAEWLDDHYQSLRYDQLNKLLDRAKNTSVNLGYVPAPGHEKGAVRTLTNGATDTSTRRYDESDAIFYKKIDPTLTIKPDDTFI